MKTLTLLTLATAGMLLASFPCQAARGRIIFGQHDRQHELTDVSLSGPDGEALALAFKTSSLFLGLGIYCKDDGYVLRKKSDPETCLVLPAEEMERFHAAGLLPRPLPGYKVPLWEYAAGYSLWWVALVAIGYLKVKDRFTRAKRSVPLPSATAVR